MKLKLFLINLSLLGLLLVFVTRTKFNRPFAQSFPLPSPSPTPIQPQAECVPSSWGCTGPDVLNPDKTCKEPRRIKMPSPTPDRWICVLCATAPEKGPWEEYLCPTDQDFGQKDGTAKATGVGKYFYFDHDQSKLIDIPPVLPSNFSLP